MQASTVTDVGTLHCFLQLLCQDLSFKKHFFLSCKLNMNMLGGLPWLSSQLTLAGFSQSVSLFP